MLYKNTTNSTKIFYGVKFRPNEIKEVQGYINTPGFIKVENNTININNTNKGKTRREKIDNNTKAVEMAQTALDEIGGFKKVEKENNANANSANINTNINTVKGVEKADKAKEEKAIENSGSSNSNSNNNKVISESKTSEK